MRLGPWELPFAWPTRNCSRSNVGRPRAASQRAEEVPMAPPPTTITSQRSGCIPGERVPAGRVDTLHEGTTTGRLRSTGGWDGEGGVSGARVDGGADGPAAGRGRARRRGMEPDRVEGGGARR